MALYALLPTPTEWVGCLAPSVCLFVCLSICLSAHNSKTNERKVFKLRTEIEGIMDILETMWFGVERSKVKVTGLISAFSH